MTPNFALSLSFDGLRLMHRVTGGWHLVGEVALDDPDLTGALARLRAQGAALDPAPMATKILIPNEQIKYLALDTTRAEEAEVRAALDGATPYTLDDLAYDFAKGGGRTYVAAVARETLAEAEGFAAENGFNPVCFVAVPEPFTYVGEAFFGAVNGADVTRDAEPVVVIGRADVPEIDVPAQSETDAAASAAPEAIEPVPEPAPEPAPETTPDAPTALAPEPEPTPDPAPETEVEDAPEVQATDVAPDAVEPPEVEASTDAPQHTDEPEPDDTPEPAVEAPADPQPAENNPAPLFASRLRADRSDGQPAAPSDDAAGFSSRRTEPSLRRIDPASLAVPTDTGDAPAPRLTATRDDAAVAPAATPITTDAPDPAPDAAPPVTGEAATAVDPVVAAATLAVEPDDRDDAQTDDKGSAAATALGAVGAVGGAVGGMFASRRKRRAEAASSATDDAASDEATDEKSRLTVFGARKPPKKKEKIVVGGKPRFLGLILTAVLLLFLLAIAAFAALSEEGLAGLFGWGDDDTQIAAPADPVISPAAPEVAAPTEPETTTLAAPAPDALATPTAPTGGQVLTPEEAQRIYAATGVWQRAPRIPLTPRTTSLDGLSTGGAFASVPRVPPSPLGDPDAIAADVLFPTPIDPPPPTATFNFDADGFVEATPDGAVTPDGILVIAGAPPLNPPTRPGTVAPEVTPQDQLAEVIPEDAAPVADAPEGVLLINGRPSIEPPIRPGTSAPAPAPEAAALAEGAAPLVATDGLLVLAGQPPVLPPIRPGTQAPSAPVVDAALTETAPTDTPTDTAPDATSAAEEGLNLIAGPPPVLPPVRPGTVAPQPDDTVDSLTADVAAALASDTPAATAQTPDATTPRPTLRPASITQAAVAAANTPVLGALTLSEAAAFRPRTRPSGLAPEPEPDPEPEPEPVAAEPATLTLEIAPEIAAAVQAAANRPDPIVNATPQAVQASVRPDGRPRNMDRIVSRAQEAQERAAAQQVAVQPARTVAPTGPTAGTVAQNATLENAINLREVNLIGIYGGDNDRRALVRLSNGRFVRVTRGDRLDGGRVDSISATALRYTKRGRQITLTVGG